MNQYRKADYRLCCLATYPSTEIDIVVDRGAARRPLAVEIKSTARIDESEARKLESLASDLQPERIFYLSCDPVAARVGAVECLHWQQGLAEIFL